MGHIDESLKTKEILTTKIIIKYHNKLTKRTGISNEITNTSKKFPDTLTKVGYVVLKNIPDINEIIYDKFAIIQASQLKEKH